MQRLLQKKDLPMIKNKNLLYLFAALFIASSSNVFTADYIYNASYYIHTCKDGKSTALFYTHEGDLIKTFVKFHEGSCVAAHERCEQLLDPKAPKPRPTHCLIKLEAIRQDGEEWSITFYDKNNNAIKNYGYIKSTHTILIYETQQQFNFNPLSPHEIASTFPLDLKGPMTVDIPTEVRRDACHCLFL
jgi:hypothetical protein